MEDSFKMKVAVVGCGMISDIYLKNMIERFEILDVVACAARHLSSAQAKAEKYGIEARTVDEVFADPDIDIVVNLTPAVAHYDIVKRALLAGKHAYTEKILTSTYGEADELRCLAAEKGLRLGVSPDTFLGGAIQTGALAARQGLIGRVTSCHVAVNRDYRHIYAPDNFFSQKGGGIGFDMGIYYVTALLSMFGPVESVTGFAANTCPDRVVENPAMPTYGEAFQTENENIMVAALRFKNGMYATLHFTADSVWPEHPTFTLYGQEGILELPDPDRFDGTTTLYKKGSPEGVALPQSFGYATNSRGLGVAEMAWAIRQGRPHRASADMACHAVEVLSGIVTASETGQVQRMRSSFEVPAPLPEGYLDNYAHRNPEAALAI